MYDDKLFFRDSGVVFTLKGDILSMITDYAFNKTDSPDAKQFNNFLDEMHFDIHKKGGKGSRDRTLIDNYYNKRSILKSGLRTTFHSENSDELCDRIKLILLEKQAGNNSNTINEEMFAIIDKLLEYKCIISTQHKKNKNILILFSISCLK